MPRISPLGDIDWDDVNIGDDADYDLGLDLNENLTVSPAITSIKRQLLLAKLVMARGHIEVDQAIQLAAELAFLLDQIQTERLSLEDLSDLVPSEYTVH